MKFLITAPTDMELNGLKESHPFKKHDCTFLVSGVGVVATTFQLTQILSKQTFDAVIQVGICGSYSEKLPVLSLVKVETEYFLDNGKNIPDEGLKNLFELQLKTRQPQYDTTGSIQNNSTFFQSIHLPIVQASTVSLMMSKQNACRQKLIEKHHLSIETLEGFAFHFVCDLFHIPYIQMRSVSNKVTEQDKTQWQITQAIQQYEHFLMDFFS